MARKKMTAAEKKAFVERMRKAREGTKRKAPAKRKSPAKRKAAPKKTAAKRKTPAKKVSTRRQTQYCVRIETTRNVVGYLSGWKRSGPEFDDDIRKAKGYTKSAAETLQYAIVSTKPRGVRTVEVIVKK
jgi:hypothetical protein